MPEYFTISCFGQPPQEIDFPEDLFANLVFRAKKEESPALYTYNFYQFYYMLAKYLQPKSVLEIGTRYGYSLIAICKGSQPKRVTSIDLQHDHSESQRIAKENFKACTSLDADFIIGDSQKIDLVEKFDFIHIDGNHGEDGCFSDIMKYRNNLTPNGTMAVDDLDCPSVWAAFSKVDMNKDFFPTKHGMGLLRN